MYSRVSNSKMRGVFDEDISYVSLSGYKKAKCIIAVGNDDNGANEDEGGGLN